MMENATAPPAPSPRASPSSELTQEELKKWPVGERIGQGAFGDAFLVSDPKTRDKYVLKRIRMARQNEWQRTATRQEIKLGSMLQHPFIVKFVRSWIRDGHEVNIVYAYCSQGDLQTVLKKQKGKHVEEQQLRRWLAEMLLALHYMQAKHVLHRDLKSSNIFLTAENDVQIGDFGLATIRDIEDSSNHDQSIVGTPHFMSPEVLNRKKYDYKTDVWSLGCVVYELTALRSPFNAFNLNGLVSKICKSAVAPLPSQYSEDWSSVIKWMLRKSASKRPSVEDLLASQPLRADVLWACERARQLSPGVQLPPLPLPTPLLRQLSTMSSCLLPGSQEDDLLYSGDDSMLTPQRALSMLPDSNRQGSEASALLVFGGEGIEEGGSSEDAKAGVLDGSSSWDVCGKELLGGAGGTDGGAAGESAAGLEASLLGSVAASGERVQSADEAESPALPAAAAAASCHVVLQPVATAAGASCLGGDVKEQDTAKAGKGAARGGVAVGGAAVASAAGSGATAVPGAVAGGRGAVAGPAAAAGGTKRVRRHSSLAPALFSAARAAAVAPAADAAELGAGVGLDCGAAGGGRGRTVRVTRQLRSRGAEEAAPCGRAVTGKAVEAGQQQVVAASLGAPGVGGVAAREGGPCGMDVDLVEPPNKRTNSSPPKQDGGGAGSQGAAAVEVSKSAGGAVGRGRDEPRSPGELVRGRERREGTSLGAARAKKQQPPWRPGSLVRASSAAGADVKRGAGAAAAAAGAGTGTVKAVGSKGAGTKLQAGASVEQQQQDTWHSSQDSVEGEVERGSSGGGGGGAESAVATVLLSSKARVSPRPAGGAAPPFPRAAVPAPRPARSVVTAAAVAPAPAPARKLGGPSGGSVASGSLPVRERSSAAARGLPRICSLPREPSGSSSRQVGPSKRNPAVPLLAAAAAPHGRKPVAGGGSPAAHHHHQQQQPEEEPAKQRSPSVSVSGQLLCEEFSLLSLPPGLQPGLMRSSSCSSLNGKEPGAASPAPAARARCRSHASASGPLPTPLSAGSDAGFEALTPPEQVPAADGGDDVDVEHAQPQLFDNQLFQSPNSRKQGGSGSRTVSSLGGGVLQLGTGGSSVARPMALGWGASPADTLCCAASFADLPAGGSGGVDGGAASSVPSAAAVAAWPQECLASSNESSHQLPARLDLGFAGFAAATGPEHLLLQLNQTPPFPVLRASEGDGLTSEDMMSVSEATPCGLTSVTRRLEMSSSAAGSWHEEGSAVEGDSPMQPGSLGKWFGAAAAAGTDGNEERQPEERQPEEAGLGMPVGSDLGGEKERLVTLERIVALARTLHEMGRWHELGNVLSSVRRPEQGREAGPRLQQGSGDGTAAGLAGRQQQAVASGPWISSPGGGCRVLNIGDKVIVGSRKGIATIRYFGPCHWAAGEYVGLELDCPEGKHEGEVDGIVYFRCLPMHGIFVKSSVLKPAKA